MSVAENPWLLKAELEKDDLDFVEGLEHDDETSKETELKDGIE